MVWRSLPEDALSLVAPRPVEPRPPVGKLLDCTHSVEGVAPQQPVVPGAVPQMQCQACGRELPAWGYFLG